MPTNDSSLLNCRFNATFRPSRASSGIHRCMPDEARDGRNVSLKRQLRSDESFVGVLDRPK